MWVKRVNMGKVSFGLENLLYSELPSYKRSKFLAIAYKGARLEIFSEELSIEGQGRMFTQKW